MGRKTIDYGRTYTNLRNWWPKTFIKGGMGARRIGFFIHCIGTKSLFSVTNNKERKHAYCMELFLFCTTEQNRQGRQTKKYEHFANARFRRMRNQNHFKKSDCHTIAVILSARPYLSKVNQVTDSVSQIISPEYGKLTITLA